MDKPEIHDIIINALNTIPEGTGSKLIVESLLEYAAFIAKKTAPDENEALEYISLYLKTAFECIPKKCYHK